jgi:hypothetical protein
LADRDPCIFQLPATTGRRIRTTFGHWPGRKGGED